MASPLQFGIVGVCGRGRGYRIPATHDERVHVAAVCDVAADGLPDAKEAFAADAAYTDYHEMLWEADLDAVLLATPKEHHVPQSVAALERGLHVLCEVPAARSIEESKELARAVEAAEGEFMLGENDVFRREWMLVAALVEDGRFGEPYYARSERITDGKDHIEQTLWRRTWRVGRNGVTYPTHNLGPLMQWFADDRIARVSCSGSGHHHEDPRGEPYTQEDTVVMQANTEQGRLIVHRQDILSDRPAVPYRFELQGTDGCFESAEWAEADHRVWLQNESDGWESLSAYEDRYLPELWRQLPDVAAETGRNGGDYLVFQTFVDALEAGESPLIDVHDGLDMTLPGLVSERSIADGGAWYDVPDSRDWV